jgi:hypothetical protein
VICPACNEPQAHRSHRAGFQDWLAGLGKRTPYRCRACKERFYVYLHGETSSKMRTPEEQRIMKIRRRYKWKQSKRQLIAYGFCAVIFVGILILILQQRTPTE